MKIIKESLNEVISFKREGDPLSTLGIGKRKLIEDWLKEIDFANYKINNDLTIDLQESLDMGIRHNVYNLPEYIQFNRIKGYCYLDHKNLTSLKGWPKYVESWFSCSNNKLTSLKGCPKYVHLDFYCDNNAVDFSCKDVLKYCDVERNIIVFKIL